jgi:exonuclease VII small subunit
MPTITTPSEIYPIQRAPVVQREEQLRGWFEYQFKQLRDRVDRLETSSVGEFATLLDSLRQQVRSVENNELARVAEVNKLGRSAIEAARGRVDDVMSNAKAEFVSHAYLHSWIARVNDQLDEMRALLNKLAPTPAD